MYYVGWVIFYKWAQCDRSLNPTPDISEWYINKWSSRSQTQTNKQSGVSHNRTKKTGELFHSVQTVKYLHVKVHQISYRSLRVLRLVRGHLDGLSRPTLNTCTTMQKCILENSTFDLKSWNTLVSLTYSLLIMFKSGSKISSVDGLIVIVALSVNGTSWFIIAEEKR